MHSCSLVRKLLHIKYAKHFLFGQGLNLGPLDHIVGDSSRLNQILRLSVLVSHPQKDCRFSSTKHNWHLTRHILLSNELLHLLVNKTHSSTGWPCWNYLKTLNIIYAARIIRVNNLLFVWRGLPSYGLATCPMCCRTPHRKAQPRPSEKWTLKL